MGTSKGSDFITDRDALKFAIDNGIIDLASIQKQVEMKEREKYLNMHPYKIWQGIDGKWRTYFIKDGGRKLKKLSSQKALEDFVINYWKENEDSPTFGEMFNAWNNHRLEIKSISPATYTRNKCIFKRFCNDISNIRISSFTEDYLIDFLEKQPSKYNLKAKAFSGLKGLFRGVFKYAKRRKYTTIDIESVLNSAELSELKFFKEIKEDNEEVFTEDETYVFLQYLVDHQDTTNLCLLLMFVTGIRVGEATTLKNEDIQDGYINIRRTQTTYYDSDGKIVHDVKDFPKTNAGWRSVVIPESYLWILNKIKKLNPYGEYVFLKNNGERLTTSSVRTRLDTINKNLGITSKSTHKIRKTYATILLDYGIDKQLVKQQMGHSQISLTENVYHRNRKTIDRKREILSEIPDFRKEYIPKSTENTGESNQSNQA